MDYTEDAEMEERYWKQFESSGKIEDYLTFVSNMKDGDTAGQERTESHAGTYIGNGNHTETDPGRGI